MRRTLAICLSVLVVPFLIYCGNQATSAGFVRSALAQSAPQAFTKIAEGDFPGDSSVPTPVVSVAPYREVVITLTTGTSCDWLWPQFRPDANTPFGVSGQSMPSVSSSKQGLPPGGRARVDGVDMQLASNCSGHYVLTGVQ